MLYRRNIVTLWRRRCRCDLTATCSADNIALEQLHNAFIEPRWSVGAVLSLSTQSNKRVGATVERRRQRGDRVRNRLRNRQSHGRSNERRMIERIDYSNGYDKRPELHSLILYSACYCPGGQRPYSPPHPPEPARLRAPALARCAPRVRRTHARAMRSPVFCIWGGLNKPTSSVISHRSSVIGQTGQGTKTRDKEKKTRDIDTGTGAAIMRPHLDNGPRRHRTGERHEKDFDRTTRRPRRTRRTYCHRGHKTPPGRPEGRTRHNPGNSRTRRGPRSIARRGNRRSHRMDRRTSGRRTGLETRRNPAPDKGEIKEIEKKK